MFWHEETVGSVTFAFTDRDGGVSDGPWQSLNLGTSNGDDPARVEANLARLAAGLGVERLVRMTQVHGADVAWVDELDEGQVAVADVLLSRTPGVGILVRVADCVPIVLVAPGQSFIGVVHCGRAGLVAGAVRAAVHELRAHGASSLQAWLGPRACGRCYELPADLADAVAATAPAARSTTSWGTPAVDVGAGVMAQLEALGVRTTDLGAKECTIEHERWFSYRRQGHDSGRFGAVAVIR